MVDGAWSTATPHCPTPFFGPPVTSRFGCGALFFAVCVYVNATRVLVINTLVHGIVFLSIPCPLIYLSDLPYVMAD